MFAKRIKAVLDTVSQALYGSFKKHSQKEGEANTLAMLRLLSVSISSGFDALKNPGCYNCLGQA